MKLNLILLVLTSLVLSACGPGRSVERTRAVGVDTALGQSLTHNKWCTPASTDGVNRPNFTTLDLRQTGKFFRSTYTLADDRSLKLETKDQGTWALIFDQLFTQVEGGAAETQAKVSLLDDSHGKTATSAKISSRARVSTEDSCVRLAVFGRDAETFCACDFVQN